MSVPVKPWESCNRLHQNNFLRSGSVRNVLHSTAPAPTSHPVGNVRSAGLPPLPIRPPHLCVSSIQNRPYTGLAPTMFGGYSGYSGYNGYSSYGGYPSSMYLPGAYGYGSYGHPSGAFESRFLQAAEESSRNAFQSIESLVRAFTSVSMMLESTYHAMYSSFRAVLGVVDNFSRLRQMFAQFLSAITVLRIIQNFYRRLLYWLGVIDHSPQSEQIWESVTAGDANSQQVANYSSWPLFTFVALLFGGPYLISKLFSSNAADPKKWDPKTGKFYRAAYPHEAESEAELSFSANEILNVAPVELQQEGTGWLLAANRNGQTGYIPITRLAAAKPDKLTSETLPSSDVDSSVQSQN